MVTDLIEQYPEGDDEEYAEWWIAQFPCECGHSPDSHFLAPIDGVCRSCKECHGEVDGMLRYSQALVKAMEEDDATTTDTQKESE